MTVSRFLSAVRATVRSLDIERANYLFSSERVGRLEPSHPLYRSDRSVLRSFMRIARELKHLTRVAESVKWYRQSRVDVVYFAHTQNQFDALRGSYERCGSTKRFIVTTGVKRVGGLDPVVFPTGLAALLALPFLPALLPRAFRASGYTRQSYKYAFDNYWLSYGLSVVWHMMLQSVEPRVVVGASDHDLHAGVLLGVTRDLDLPLVYIQHASVAETFPPLAMDYAFLEGEDSYRKYLVAGHLSAQVYLTGMPKADGAKPIRHRQAAEGRATVGVATNALDSISDITALVGHPFASAGGIRFVIRPHPRTPPDQKVQIQGMATEQGHAFSDPDEEPTAAFLHRIDVLVAGESSIHLEAAVKGVEPIYYAPAAHGRDVYGYVARGLIRYVARSSEDVFNVITELGPKGATSALGRAKYYVDTVGTSYFGRSAEIVAGLVDEIASSGSVCHKGWTPLEQGMSAYRLRT